MKDAIDKTNAITFPSSGLTNSWGNLYFDLNMDDYYIEWYMFFIGITYYTSGNIKRYNHSFGSTFISHRKSRSTVYDWCTTSRQARGQVGVFYGDYITCSIQKSALDTYGSVSNVTKTSFGVNGQTIHY